MASLSTQEQADLQSAIDLMVKGTARETPLADDVIERINVFVSRLAPESTGIFKEIARDRPVSLMIALVEECGWNILTASESRQLFSGYELMLKGTAYETPFALDVIQRLAPVAASTGFLTLGGFHEAIRDRPFSTMLRWALFLGSR